MHNHAEKRNVAGLSVLAAIFLTGFKLLIGLLTGSLGILSEALHSGLDLVAAVITYFSVRISDKPADRSHNFGHGKVENLSAFLETILLLITCVWIIYEAVHRLATGKTEIDVNVWSYVVVVSSIIIDFTRSRALSRVAKKHNSQALEADALHFSTDIWSSSVVLLGLICANFGFYFADSIAALGVAFIVLFVSFRLGKKAIDVLLDRNPESTYQKINSILSGIKEITYFHDIKVRTAGA
ncbi:MAG: cation diffusion facilitator family transporter, partial [Bacteroidota bacterium]|nr:cation diffusion facilitator family transporter [Bacteroidota bacterium]